METIHESQASLRHFRSSARKARLVLDMIRGKGVNEAKNILEFSHKKIAKDIQKLLKSAVANINQVSGKEDTANMVISKAFADGGRIIKKPLYRAQGSSDRILKRTCHITIGLKVVK
ncbi:MAG: 50S ribosomal protein L22 [Candidatus Cloacimonetes bacterium]|nr:50S ribosomal protein L22 [Candidatus Cloacimonadota bacterium]